MGCDIHIHVEVWVNGRWRGVRGTSPYWDSNWYDGERLCYEGWIYNGRNYKLFGILADVRNGWGFAGIDIGDPAEPISVPKGLPHDLSSELKENVDFDWGHSHTYLTLQELQEYNWDKELVFRGYVNPSNYKSYKENGYPDGWSGDVSGSTITKVSNEEMENVLMANEHAINKSYYTNIEWTMKASEYLLFDEVLHELSNLSTSPQNVRIVFFFDN